jgi:hypothetical protein
METPLRGGSFGTLGSSTVVSVAPGAIRWRRIHPHGFARADAVIPTQGFLLWVQPDDQQAGPPTPSELQVERVVNQTLQIVPIS